ncbi:MAG: NapC/NirT family cytochrome c [Chromatiaceae bacterium]
MSEEKPRTAKKALTLLLIGGVVGIVFWGGFNTAMEATNTETFCISCHEMKDNVYKELQDTIHYQNRTGVRATCPDCHVPKDWVHKLIRKVQASNELYHKFMGTIDTRQKFEAHRIELAQNVWTAMKKTDSRECRNCHNFDSMDYDKQDARSSTRHEDAQADGLTCIDCHKGIAHKLPKEYSPEKDIAGQNVYYRK